MIRSTRGFAAALLAVGALAACGKKHETVDTTTSAGTIAPPATTPASQLQVADVTLGRSLGPDKQVKDPTDKFKPKDTIYASVRTTGSGSGQLVGRWTYQDGQKIDERTESIAPTAGEARTEFHIAKPSGWPVGKYTFHALLNGTEVETKDFEVAK